MHQSYYTKLLSTKIYIIRLGQPIPSCLPRRGREDKLHYHRDIKNHAVPYSKKEKSLVELSKKFCRKFGRIDDCIISLEQVVIDLGIPFYKSPNFNIGVERRRIYDIINILESLGVIYRQRKN